MRRNNLLTFIASLALVTSFIMPANAAKHKELPAWGFYVRHADGVTFKNVKLTALKKDYRPAIVLDDVHNGAFTKIKVVEPSAGKKEKIQAYKSTKIKK